MRALITNDDGIDSAGLRSLAPVAVAAGLKVTVAAPDGQRSGSSAAMSGLAEGGRLLVEDRTLDGLADVRTVAVRASPAMIVFLGAHGAFGADCLATGDLGLPDLPPPSCAGCTRRGWPPTRWRGPSSASPVTASSL